MRARARDGRLGRIKGQPRSRQGQGEGQPSQTPLPPNGERGGEKKTPTWGKGRRAKNLPLSGGAGQDQGQRARARTGRRSELGLRGRIKMLEDLRRPKEA